MTIIKDIVEIEVSAQDVYDIIEKHLKGMGVKMDEYIINIKEVSDSFDGFSTQEFEGISVRGVRSD